MSLHDRLLATLESIAGVRLVAALRDERLNFPDPNDLRVFIPDVHLITEQRRVSAGFQYATNFLQSLPKLVAALRDFKQAVAADERVVVYQLGDLIDLWRETDGLDPDLDVASAIANDHEDLMAALLDPALNTQFLLGNHDYDLYRFPNFAAWQRYLYLSPSVMLLHGDIFDWVEKLPAAVKNFFVFLFSPSVKPASAELERMRPLNQQMRSGNQFRAFIQNAAPAPLGPTAPPVEIPARFNVQMEGAAPPAMLKFLDAAQQKCLEANQQFGTDLRVAVIGHTHHARIAVREDGGSLFTLLDCGAWIENCVSEDDPTPQPNAQIAALGANEARIYQLANLL